MKLLRSVLVLLAASVLAIPAYSSAALAEAIRVELDRASAKVERLRMMYEEGAASRREVEDAEAEMRDVERRLRQATGEPRDLNVAEAQRRVEDARADYEKAAAKAKRLGELYELGAVARNEKEAADTAAQQAEIYFKLNEELARRVEMVARMPVRPPQPDGDGGFSPSVFFFLQDEFFKEFRQPLPISAFGPSETHEKLGFDHEGRIDIALHPDSSEGRWFIAQLQARHIPFIAFRNAVAGKATGAHIHMGLPSPVTHRAAS